MAPQLCYLRSITVAFACSASSAPTTFTQLVVCCADIHTCLHFCCGAGSLSLQGRQLVCDKLVAEDKAFWLKPEKDKRACIVTRQPVRVWADTIARVVDERFATKVLTLENLYSGEDVKGTGMLAPCSRMPSPAFESRSAALQY